MQLSNTWKATVGLMIGAILCLPAQAAAEKKIIMRYSHSSAAMVEEPHHTAALDFKKYVEEKTKGKVEVQIYPASQLGGEERAFQDVQQNVIQIASLASNNAAVFAPSLYVIDLPYLFRTNQEGWAILDKYWDELNAKTIRESGNRIIGWLDLGYRHICNSKRPVRTIEDLKGLKIRVPNNPVMINTFRAWGCEPTPLAWDETFNALQQKVVDGQENPYPVFASNKFEEVQKYITEIHYKVWIGPIVVNAAWLKKQPEDVQKAILEGGRLATENNRKMIAEMEVELVKAIKDKGVEILAKPEDEPVWQEKAMNVWPQFYDKIGDISLLDTMMKSLGRTRPQ
ncbi:TRAP transporter substrate-binding protein [uncultured Bilophila sp.]|uniref:TRAP transporter substrate-binding protein n=1 Tax=uncultured Bilophila sp. TaxID=529385 RepID=UPI00280B1F0F|nr:TRAP transporter substrate-binding protein [uncultured Bilophila sp.]